MTCINFKVIYLTNQGSKPQGLNMRPSDFPDLPEWEVNANSFGHPDWLGAHAAQATFYSRNWAAMLCAQDIQYLVPLW